MLRLFPCSQWRRGSNRQIWTSRPSEPATRTRRRAGPGRACSEHAGAEHVDLLERAVHAAEGVAAAVEARGLPGVAVLRAGGAGAARVRLDGGAVQAVDEVAALEDLAEDDVGGVERRAGPRGDGELEGAAAAAGGDGAGGGVAEGVGVGGGGGAAEGVLAGEAAEVDALVADDAPDLEGGEEGVSVAAASSGNGGRARNGGPRTWLPSSEIGLEADAWHMRSILRLPSCARAGRLGSSSKGWHGATRRPAKSSLKRATVSGASLPKRPMTMRPSMGAWSSTCSLDCRDCFTAWNRRSRKTLSVMTGVWDSEAADGDGLEKNIQAAKGSMAISLRFQRLSMAALDGRNRE